MKLQQNLLVDFGAFPDSIRQLSRRCGEGEGKFSLVLKPAAADSSSSSSDAVLSFQETNPFRELCHLSLQVCRGTDRQVKEYLAECIRQLQGMGQEESGRAARLEEELGKARAKVEEKTAEVRVRLCTHLFFLISLSRTPFVLKDDSS